MHGGQRDAELLVGDANAESETIVDGHHRRRRGALGDELALHPQGLADALAHEEVERAPGMPEIRIAELSQKLLARALLDELEADALDELAEVAGGHEGDLMSPIAQGERQS